MKTAFLFSGQGAQYPGMMGKFEYKNVLEVADRVLGRDISKLVLEGPQEELNVTRNTQPCILAADLIAYEHMEYKPDAVAGFSLGEYAALVVAGVLDIEIAFSIVQKRADAMQEAAPIGSGAMAAILKQDDNQVKDLCDSADGYVVPVNYNCPGQIVVSGEVEAVDKLIEKCKIQKIRAIKLPVSAPCHCKIMNPASEILEKEFSKIKFNDPSIPVYVNVTGQIAKNGESIKKLLIEQVKSPVYWEKTLRNMASDGIAKFVECGPGKTLTNFVKKTLPDTEYYCVEEME